MASRRNFLVGGITTAVGAIAGYWLGRNRGAELLPSETQPESLAPSTTPYKEGLVISTWYHGLAANEAAWKVIGPGGRAIDAVEQGVAVVEADPNGGSVGIGGTPDREGKVTLDACIMDETGNAGSVSFLENILHPISVARKVMDDTPHVMLAGEGALQFAKDQGFEEIDLLTPAAKERWEKWLVEEKYKPIINIENHDTIGLLAMDKQGNLSGACTTSGLGFKMRGRVGDSPVIGAGLFVDNEVGAATATGLGEAVLKTCGSFLIVELMRQGLSPQAACEEGVRRIAAGQDEEEFQIGYLAMNKAGEVGSYAIHPGFDYAMHRDGKNEMVKVTSLHGEK
jgi:N4-(beta-N-acetylglucosaminyl)-L-asparaginase